MIIDWNDGFAVGIKQIDEQHKDLVKTVNDLYDSIYRGNPSDVIDMAFKHLIDYSRHHFDTEENYFDDFNYDDKEDHKKEHALFREELEKLESRISEIGHEKLAVDVLTFLEGWLEIHVKDVDRKYVACFKEHGLQ